MGQHAQIYQLKDHMGQQAQIYCRYFSYQKCFRNQINEIRASWSPIVEDPRDLIKHIEGWCNLIAEVSGLQPVPEGVSAITSAKRR